MLNNAFLDSLAQSRPNLLINKTIVKPLVNSSVDVIPSINVTPSTRKSKKRKQPPKVSVTVQPQAPPSQQPQSQPSPGQATSTTPSSLPLTHIASPPTVNHKVASNENSTKVTNLVGPITTSSSTLPSVETIRTTTLPSFFVSNPSFTVVSKGTGSSIVNVNNVNTAQLAQIPASSLPSLTSNVAPSPVPSQMGVVNSIATKPVTSSESVQFVNNASATTNPPRPNHLSTVSPAPSSVNCIRVNSATPNVGVSASVPPNLIPIPSSSPSVGLQTLSATSTQPSVPTQPPGSTSQLQQQPRWQAITLTTAKQQVCLLYFSLSIELLTSNVGGFILHSLTQNFSLLLLASLTI